MQINLSHLLAQSFLTHVPLLITGPPGVGKSMAVQKTVIDDLKLPVWIVVASYREPSDFGGLPVIDKKAITVNGQAFVAIRLAPPAYALEAAQKGGVIILEEVTTTPPAVQAPLLRMVHELVVGELELPKDRVAIVAIANPPFMAASGWELTPPLQNRFRHITYKLDPIEWAESFPLYWGKPPVLQFFNDKLDQDAWRAARTKVAAFIHARPQLLLQYPKQQQASETSLEAMDQWVRAQAWASPRTWDFASRFMALDDDPIQPDLSAISECVGEGPAEEMWSWLKYADLPTPEEIEGFLRKPESFQLTKDSDRNYAILTGVASHVASGNVTADRWAQGWKVIVRCKEYGATDLGVPAGRILAQCRPQGASVPLEVSIFGKIFAMAKI